MNDDEEATWAPNKRRRLCPETTNEEEEEEELVPLDLAVDTTSSMLSTITTTKVPDDTAWNNSNGRVSVAVSDISEVSSHQEDQDEQFSDDATWETQSQAQEETTTFVDTPTLDSHSVKISEDDPDRERQLLKQLLDGTPSRILKRLTLVSRLERSLPLSTLTKILRHARGMTSLGLYSSAFQCNEETFAQFCSCLTSHSSLKEFHLVDCNLVDQSIPIDSMLKALARIPTLEAVEIYAMDLVRFSPASLMSPASLASLCQSNSITSLSLEDLELTDGHMEALTTALQQNKTLTHLTLWDCNVTEQGGQLLANVIRANEQLKKMELSFNNLNENVYAAVAAALGSNTTLSSLSLHGKSSLHHRQGSLEVECTNATGSGYEKLLGVLKDGGNETLEELKLGAEEEDPRLTLYLTLNQNRHLFRGDVVTRQQLVQSLAKYSEQERGNLSFVFSLLKAYPVLCELDR